jgi:hypothetical protein
MIEQKPVAWVHTISGGVVGDDAKIPGVTLDDFTIPLFTESQLKAEVEKLLEALGLIKGLTGCSGAQQIEAMRDIYSISRKVLNKYNQ